MTAPNSVANGNQETATPEQGGKFANRTPRFSTAGHPAAGKTTPKTDKRVGWPTGVED